MNSYDYLVPVSPGRVVYIQGPFPLTEDEWVNFERVLALFKPGLVTEPEPPPAAVEEDET